ncbi:hypothetical protein [Halomonas heilongjiangensis]|uniref:Uncharacterized protein n=1 Tax=Halomonas heilongjiangensis TaxID=1387883 RepID=A0A2N7TIQ5_9GAMM|nr:hypothetical protein [Halomonas heilongjiangensis]PMR68048.1 hypothetical protein C1H66_16660 [Halomonas heilongjiangensis]PXX92200.1 hypothetical protein CR158_05940 [Halomonas heilongjiangensis]
MNTRLLALLLPILLLAGCAAQPDRPETLRQALFGLGERAAERVIEAPPLPRPPADQVLLLATPEVDDALSIGRERFLESLTRALLGTSDGPQVLDWSDAMAEGGGDNQWRLDSRLEADGPRLQLSDRELLPYRLNLALRRPGSEEALWETEIHGAFDATAL